MYVAVVVVLANPWPRLYSIQALLMVNHINTRDFLPEELEELPQEGEAWTIPESEVCQINGICLLISSYCN